MAFLLLPAWKPQLSWGTLIRGRRIFIDVHITISRPLQRRQEILKLRSILQFWILNARFIVVHLPSTSL